MGLLRSLFRIEPLVDAVDVQEPRANLPGALTTACVTLALVLWATWWLRRCPLSMSHMITPWRRPTRNAGGLWWRRSRGGEGSDGSDRSKDVRIELQTGAAALLGRLFLRRRNMRSSASEGRLPHGPGGRQFDNGVERLDREELRPETDHERFEKAWKEHICFSEYRRLVLPPECKNEIPYWNVWLSKNTFYWRDDSFLGSLGRDVVACASYVRNVLDVLCSILAQLFRRERLRRSSRWIVNAITFLFCRRRLWTNKIEDDTHNDDEGSLMTFATDNDIHGSDDGSMATAETRPVMINRKSPRHLPQNSQKNSAATPQDKTPKHGRCVARAAGVDKCGNDKVAQSLHVPSAFMDKRQSNATDAAQDSKSRVSDGTRPCGEVYDDEHDVASQHDLRVAAHAPASPAVPDVFPVLTPVGRDSDTLNFFDTANSDHQLRDMSRAVPMPDANGYILGDEFLGGTSCAPLLVIVNSRSGSRQGRLLMHQFRRLLNPIQVSARAAILLIFKNKYIH